MKKFLLVATATAAFAAPASAKVFEIGDFGNPVFTYAQHNGGSSFTVFSTPCELGGGACVAGPDGRGNSQVVYDAGSSLVAHPGTSGTTAILFTAPRSSVYTFNGSASLADGNGPGTDGVGVAGYFDGAVFPAGILAPPVGGAGASQSFNGSIFLNAGQQVGVVFSNNGSNSNDSVLVSGFVSGAIPESATWAMMIMGFGLIGAAMRRAKPRVAVSFA